MTSLASSNSHQGVASIHYCKLMHKVDILITVSVVQIH